MTYIVQHGETLGDIARLHGTSIDALQSLNGIANPNHIREGQSLKLPATRQASAHASESETWSTTVLRFVDALERPIVNLAVRLVSEGRELLATTKSDGTVQPVALHTPGASIDVHVQRAPHKGGGEKHIGSFQPSPGKQTVKVRSGKQLVQTKIRRHEGPSAKPPKNLRHHPPGSQMDTATPAGHPLTCVKCGECPNEDDLLLGPNLEFKLWVKAAASRAEVIPQAVAAVMNAEAAKLKDGKWNARSESKKSSATGMTQFLDGTWVDEAVRAGTYLNDKARKEGWLSQDAKGNWTFKKADGSEIQGPGLARKLTAKAMITDRRKASDKHLQQLLDLRYEAEFAILAAMDYASHNLQCLSAKGYDIASLNDTEKARIMYLCHHLGIGDAAHFIQNTIPEEDVTGLNKKGKTALKQNGAKKLLTAQVGKAVAEKKYVEPNGKSWVKGHRNWLNGFIRQNIKTSVFACPGEKQNQYLLEEEGGALLGITEKLKK